MAVVFGGRSSEHAVSCVSAGSVVAALDPQRFEVVPVGITRAGRWVLQPDHQGLLEGSKGEQTDPRAVGSTGMVADALPEVAPDGTAVVLAGDPSQPGLLAADSAGGPAVLADVDVVFPVLHGPYGEDGTLQGLLELAGIPYVGSGVFASAAAMDKAHAKACLAVAGLPLGPYRVVTDRSWRAEPDRVLKELDQLGLPVFVKPARAGSSVGISKVHRAEDLSAAIEAARQHDPRVVVEASVEGAREIECGVLADVDGAPRASVCAEIVVRSGHEFYDFEAKYLDDSAELNVPAELSSEVSTYIQDLAVQAFEALTCEGLARVDFFVLPNGSVLLNEVNTMPGFTPISMFPRMWAASGVDYPTLVDRLVSDALRRGTGLR